MPIYSINPDNIDLILPSLPWPSNLKQNISDSVVNFGQTAVVPQSGLQVNQWYGYGWQVLDLNTGAASYFIAGNLVSGTQLTTTGGGSTTRASSDSDWWLKFWLTGFIWAALTEALAKPGITQMITGVELGLLGAGLIPFGVGTAMVTIAVVGGIIIYYGIWGSSTLIRRRWYAFTIKALTFG
jgi:hypothetical protein